MSYTRPSSNYDRAREYDKPEVYALLAVADELRALRELLAERLVKPREYVVNTSGITPHAAGLMLDVMNQHAARKPAEPGTDGGQ